MSDDTDITRTGHICPVSGIWTTLYGKEIALSKGERFPPYSGNSVVYRLVQRTDAAAELTRSFFEEWIEARWRVIERVSAIAKDCDDAGVLRNLAVVLMDLDPGDREWWQRNGSAEADNSEG